MNVSRMFAVKALVRVGWRALTPAGITVITTCDHGGKIIDQNHEQNKKKKAEKKKEDDDSDDDDDEGGSKLSPRSGTCSTRGDNETERSISLDKCEHEHDTAGQMPSPPSGTPEPDGKNGTDDDDNDDDAKDHDPTQVSASVMRRHISTYESAAMRYLALTLLVHVPYLIVLFLLKDPFGWGSPFQIAPPRPSNQP